MLMAVCVALCGFTGIGCNLSDAGPSPYRSPDQFFAVLSLEHHAINLSMVAPYDTVTLHTVHAMGDGSAVPGEVVYSVSSPSISITNGVLKAERPVALAVVHATLTYGTITRTDSAIVSVIAAAPNRLRDFGLRLPSGDSAKIGASKAVVKTIPLLRESESGANLSTLLIALISSDSTIASITQSGNTVKITPKRPGRVVLYTSTFAFGTAWQDSLVFTVGWPTQFQMSVFERFATGTFTPVLDFAARDVTIGVGGCVLWKTQSLTMDVDLHFEDPSHVDAPIGSSCAVQLADPTVGGNIASFRAIRWVGPFPTTEEGYQEYARVLFSPNRARVFSASGVFPYRSTLHGTSGIVRVCDERNDTTCAPSGIGSWY